MTPTLTALPPWESCVLPEEGGPGDQAWGSAPAPTCPAGALASPPWLSLSWLGVDGAHCSAGGCCHLDLTDLPASHPCADSTSP